jgi:hypothetical protein
LQSKGIDMKSDLYVRAVLTVVAASVAWLAVRDISSIRSANAFDLRDPMPVQLMICNSEQSCLPVQQSNPIPTTLSVQGRLLSTRP